MATSFWRHVNGVIEESDLVIEVLDARYPEETRNIEIENKVRREGKMLLFALNKCDLVSQGQMEELKKKIMPSVFLSSTQYLGTTLLKQKILEMSKGKPVVVGVLGYPNVGKSSLINALAGKASARTSAQSGFTKGVQKVRVSKKIMLLDSPGVFPYQEKEKGIHGLSGVIDASHMRDPLAAALLLLEEHQSLIQHFYGVPGEDGEEVLEEIGKKRGCLLKGGIVDETQAARVLLRDWQRGKIKKMS